MVFHRSNDLFRETNVRYLGYANEVGEALRPKIATRYVRLSYAVAMGYVLADVADKAISKLAVDGRSTKVLWATGDALIWQSFASIILPGLAINRIVHFANSGLGKYAPKMSPANRGWTAVAIGLGAIPIIVSPIDHAVHAAMNVTYRLFFS